MTPHKHCLQSQSEHRVILGQLPNSLGKQTCTLLGVIPDSFYKCNLYISVFEYTNLTVCAFRRAMCTQVAIDSVAN